MKRWFSQCACHKAIRLCAFAQSEKDEPSFAQFYFERFAMIIMTNQTIGMELKAHALHRIQCNEIEMQFKFDNDHCLIGMSWLQVLQNLIEFGRIE